jgi:uncharacterized protein with FMN-binding domain
MKTLTSISLTILFVAAVAIASANETKTQLIKSTDDLRSSFREIIESDFSDMGNYFYQNDVDKVDGRVEVYFQINSDRSVKILKVDSKSPTASKYITQLFNHEKLNITPDMVGRKFKISIKLIYRAA